MAQINSLIYFFMSIPISILAVGDIPGLKSKGRLSKYFFGMLVFDYVMVILQGIGFAVIAANSAAFDDPVTRVLIRLFFSISDASYYAILFLFLCYLNTMLSERVEVPGWVMKIGFLVCLGYAVFWIVSGFTGIIYTPTSSGMIRGPLYYPGHLGAYMITVMVLCIMINGRKYLSIMEKVAVIIFVSVPFTSFVLRSFIKGILILPLMVTYSIMILQRFIQAKRDILIQEQAAELERSKTDLLLSQIQPHFIYNALNAIYALCDISVDRAKEAIAAFADFLRGSFRRTGQNELIDFEQELHHIKSYLMIEKMRFGDALVIEYDIQAEYFKIPPLTIQPLVENAMRHGIEKNIGGGMIRIASRRTDSGYRIEITDTGAGFDTSVIADRTRSDGQHIGIYNSGYRLEKLVKATMNIESEPGKGTHITIDIPGQTF